MALKAHISEMRAKIKKFKLPIFFLKNILNNVESNYKAQATATFLVSALISEIWAFKAKKCWYFGNKGPNKKVFYFILFFGRHSKAGAHDSRVKPEILGYILLHSKQKQDLWYLIL